MSDKVELHYRREGPSIRVTCRGDPNEIRTVMVGIWADWNADARLEFIAELAHYAVLLTFPESVPERHLPRLASVVMNMLRRKVGFDIDEAKRKEHSP